ncbi:glycerophosphodiester phosphodiesterase family protein [Saccharopolyspora sp. NFXS83]|nr:glycerophosphodiester phosphodiesterase family protein [Saccharopolyspora sp. NFXS83]
MPGMGGPEVVAHRGASAERAEHTLGAYQVALDQGADALECDVRVTRDGHLVCVHDRRVDRTSTGRGVVSELTLGAMSRFDFAQWHHELPDSADDLVFEPRASPVGGKSQRRILTFDELLGLVRAQSRPVRLFAETKHPVRYGGLVEAKLTAALARHGVSAPAHKDDSPVVMMSFSAAAVRRFRANAPGVPTVLLFDRSSRVVRAGELPRWADLAGPSVRLLRQDPELAHRLAARGRDTYCWTVDDPADVELCRRAGVRFVATNRPGATRARLAGSLG